MNRLCLACLLLAGFVMFPGCSQDAPPSAPDTGFTALSVPVPDAPSGLVSITVGEQELMFWPYTGSSFDGTPVDPINVIFTGMADPVQIRAALLALDGDRTAFGFPNEYPFNATWSEAIGNVQTAYSETGGWSGSVVQLQLGAYDPIRAHLRLFRAGTMGDQTITLGGAHFEVLIPGTTEHQVLSWEIPQQIVVVDMIRTGLLGAEPQPTGLINQAPSFREIPEVVVYNQLPDLLKVLIDGPLDPVSEPVPLVSDGQGTILMLAGAANPVAGDMVQTLSVPFDQLIPRPFCNSGPLDWVHVTGMVEFSRTAWVDGGGAYEYESGYQGHLNVTPVDVTANPPMPAGETFKAVVHGSQSGFLHGEGFKVQALDKRLATGGGGAEMLQTLLQVGSSSPNRYRERSKCLSP